MTEQRDNDTVQEPLADLEPKVDPKGGQTNTTTTTKATTTQEQYYKIELKDVLISG